MSDITPATESTNPPVRFCNFVAQSPEDLRDMCDIWLADICSAAWGWRELHRVAAFLITCVHTGREAGLYARDLESGINIQPEESQRALKMLKLFSGIEDFTSDRGRLSVVLRVSMAQRLRLAEGRARLAELSARQTETALEASIAALRAVSAGDMAALDGDNVIVAPLRAAG